ncbi:hypothetical protein [Vibrio sp. LaRot3]|uniref:hypothetical protein n=1 Tax=Vibrio sp. LaRot3 TaxID=2998829 RepID=UPI0022CE2DB0|nr:hypothetical protein [Vibrio sp. LaRot3]MDA0148506.1 hypothetical protein [Vibrio sp. LaRot3]
MDLYEVEKLLHSQGVDLKDVEIRPALVINDKVALLGKQGRNPMSFVRDIKVELEKEQIQQRLLKQGLIKVTKR